MKADDSAAVNALIAAYTAEGFTVRVDLRLDTFARLYLTDSAHPEQYHIAEGVDVLIVTYGCSTHDGADPVVSHEHQKVGLFTEAQAATLRMPDGYRSSIATWFAAQRAAQALSRRRIQDPRKSEPPAGAATRS